jgi:nucleotide-binding universal stress UspA family protein
MSRKRHRAQPVRSGKGGRYTMMRMLVATDGSPHSIRAAGLAARLARELHQAEVVLVNVGYIPVVALGGGPGPDALIDYGVWEEGLERAGQAILGRATEEFAGVDVPVSRVYRRGDAAEEIVKAAHDLKADLIIMGSRGLGQIGGLILGSVSERVLHGAHTPVLIAR